MLKVVSILFSACNSENEKPLKPINPKGFWNKKMTSTTIDTTS